MQVKFNGKRYFYFNNKIEQTDENGLYELNQDLRDFFAKEYEKVFEKDLDFANYARDYLLEHMLKERDVKVQTHGNSGARIMMSKDMIGHYVRIFYIDMGKEFKVDI